MIYYSPSTKGFYDSVNFGERDDPASRIPSDAVEVSVELHQSLVDAQAGGASIQFDPATGLPVSVMPPAMTLDGMRNIVFPEARALRTVILNALTGLGYRAMLTSLMETDPDIMTAARQIALDASAASMLLLDVTKDPRVLAVTADQGVAVLRATILAVYKDYRDRTAPDVRSAYNEVA